MSLCLSSRRSQKFQFRLSGWTRAHRIGHIVACSFLMSVVGLAQPKKVTPFDEFVSALKKGDQRTAMELVQVHKLDVTTGAPIAPGNPDRLSPNAYTQVYGTTIGYSIVGANEDLWSGIANALDGKPWTMV